MNSFCHLTFGSVAEWMFAYVLGVRQEDGCAGYGNFIVGPVTDRRLGYAEGSFESVRGTIVSGWKFEKDTISVHIEVPAGAGRG
jgi:alpha-L-rhamnosidase